MRGQSQSQRETVDGTGEPVQVLLVDDHKLVREGIAALLEEHPRIRIVGQAADGEEAIAETRRLRPQVVVMDVTMPRLNGIEATRRICKEMPATRVIGLSVHDSIDTARLMRKAGAVAYLKKDGNPDDLITIILRVAEGD